MCKQKICVASKNYELEGVAALKRLRTTGLRQPSNNVHPSKTTGLNRFDFTAFKKYLICVDNDLALLLVAAGDEEEVIERGRVVEDAIVLERVQHVPAAELQQVNAALIDGQPKCFRPIGCKRLLEW
jgi:hypothetical protein